MPLDAIDEEAMSQLPTLEFIRPTVSDVEIGSVDSQADAAQLSDEARDIFGVDGTGIKVGILSDSYNTLGGADDGIASGDLPGTGNPNGFTTPIEVLQELPNTGIDEGRAMAEIVHDDRVAIYVLYKEGWPAGFAEIDWRRRPLAEVKFFGLVPEAQGAGLGRWFLRQVLDLVWSAAPERVIIETCTMDAPQALRMYQRAGFSVYDQGRGVIEWRG